MHAGLWQRQLRLSDLQGGLGRINVSAISFGILRDLWVPMTVLAISLTTAALGTYTILTSSFWWARQGAVFAAPA